MRRRKARKSEKTRAIWVKIRIIGVKNNTMHVCLKVKDKTFGQQNIHYMTNNLASANYIAATKRNFNNRHFDGIEKNKV
jgi:hypothetical protein